MRLDALKNPLLPVWLTAVGALVITLLAFGAFLFAVLADQVLEFRRVQKRTPTAAGKSVSG